MYAAHFRYGYHPEGVDPLAELRSRSGGPIQTVARIPVASAFTPVREVQPAGPRLVVAPAPIPGSRKQGSTWLLWGALVLASVAAVGLGIAWMVDSRTHSSDSEPMAFVIDPPTVIEPDLMSFGDEDAEPSSTDIGYPEVVVSEPQSPAATKPAPAPSAPPGVTSKPPSSEPVVPTPFPSVTVSPPIRTVPPVMTVTPTASASTPVFRVPPIMTRLPRIPSADTQQSKPEDVPAPSETTPPSGSKPPKLRAPAMTPKKVRSQPFTR